MPYNSNIGKLNSSKMKNGQTVSDNLVALVAKIGEKINIKVKTLNNDVTTSIIYTVVKEFVKARSITLETSDKSDTLKTFKNNYNAYCSIKSFSVRRKLIRSVYN